jgi:hypothetical protein
VIADFTPVNLADQFVMLQREGQIMPTRYEPQDIGRIFEELAGANDRAAIAVGGSILEHALEMAVRSQLREPQTPREADILFFDNGMVGTFSEKIWAAYFLKVIGSASYLRALQSLPR